MDRLVLPAKYEQVNGTLSKFPEHQLDQACIRPFGQSAANISKGRIARSRGSSPEIRTDSGVESGGAKFEGRIELTDVLPNAVAVTITARANSTRNVAGRRGTAFSIDLQVIYHAMIY